MSILDAGCDIVYAESAADLEKVARADSSPFDETSGQVVRAVN